MGWAFCCGIFVLLFGLLLWLGLWVAGSYLILSVMQDKLVPNTTSKDAASECADATLGVAAFVLLLIWLLFTGLLVHQILQVCCGGGEGGRRLSLREEYHHQETVLLA